MSKNIFLNQIPIIIFFMQFWNFSRVETEKPKNFEKSASSCDGVKRPDPDCSGALLSVQKLEENDNIGKKDGK